MSRVWYTADTHFGHANIIEHCQRPHADVAAMDAALVEGWNRVVAPGDTVWHLGDVGLGLSALFLPLISRLHGTIHLVAGNHDAVWSGHRAAHRHQAEWLRYFATIQAFARRRIAGRDVLLAHLPYAGDHTLNDRYQAYRLPDTGMPLLCGHVHTARQVLHTERGTPQVNVGVDVWNYTPVSEDALAAHL